MNMFPVFIEVYDVDQNVKRVVNVSLFKSFTEQAGRTYIVFDPGDYIAVRETKAEILSLISQAITKLS